MGQPQNTPSSFLVFTQPRSMTTTAQETIAIGSFSACLGGNKPITGLRAKAMFLGFVEAARARGQRCGKPIGLDVSIRGQAVEPNDAKAVNLGTGHVRRAANRRRLAIRPVQRWAETALVGSCRLHCHHVASARAQRCVNIPDSKPQWPDWKATPRTRLLLPTQLEHTGKGRTGGSPSFFNEIGSVPAVSPYRAAISPRNGTLAPRTCQIV